MPMIPVNNLRACVVCAYLMEQEVLDPLNEIVNGCRIKCCWYPNQDLTGETCDGCPHFSNIHKLLSKGGADRDKNDMETHQEAPVVAGNGPDKGKGRGSAPKRKQTLTQLKFEE